MKINFFSLNINNRELLHYINILYLIYFKIKIFTQFHIIVDTKVNQSSFLINNILITLKNDMEQY